MMKFSIIQFNNLISIFKKMEIHVPSQTQELSIRQLNFIYKVLVGRTYSKRCSVPTNRSISSTVIILDHFCLVIENENTYGNDFETDELDCSV